MNTAVAIKGIKPGPSYLYPQIGETTFTTPIFVTEGNPNGAAVRAVRLNEAWAGSFYGRCSGVLPGWKLVGDVHIFPNWANVTKCDWTLFGSAKNTGKSVIDGGVITSGNYENNNIAWKFSTGSIFNSEFDLTLRVHLYVKHPIAKVTDCSLWVPGGSTNGGWTYDKEESWHGYQQSTGGTHSVRFNVDALKMIAPTVNPSIHLIQQNGVYAMSDSGASAWGTYQILMDYIPEGSSRQLWSLPKPGYLWNGKYDVSLFKHRSNFDGYYSPSTGRSGWWTRAEHKKSSSSGRYIELYDITGGVTRVSEDGNNEGVNIPVGIHFL